MGDESIGTYWDQWGQGTSLVPWGRMHNAQWRPLPGPRRKPATKRKSDAQLFRDAQFKRPKFNIRRYYMAKPTISYGQRSTIIGAPKRKRKRRRQPPKWKPRARRYTSRRRVYRRYSRY